LEEIAMNRNKATDDRSHRLVELLTISIIWAAGVFPALCPISPVARETSVWASEPAQPSSQRLYDYEGQWNVNGEILTFKVEGDKVIGTAPRTRTHIEATLAPDGLSLTAKWREPGNRSGPAVYRLSEDGKRLEGHWRQWGPVSGRVQSGVARRVGPPSPQSRYHAASNVVVQVAQKDGQSSAVAQGARLQAPPEQTENAVEQAKSQFRGERQDKGGGDTLSLAVGFYSGTGGRQDEAKARELFTQAYEAGGPLAIMWMARLRHKGRCGFPKEPKQALQLARGVIDEVIRLAKSGDREAMFLYGSAVEDGLALPVPRNRMPSVVAGLLKASALEDGPADPRNPFAGAAGWYQKAADLGNVSAMYNLAGKYQDAGNDARAVEWYRKAAQVGHADAMNRLAFRYEQGKGADRNPEEAMKWYHQAAEAGNKHAMHNLALVCAEKGNHRDALQWFTKAAALGGTEAMNCMGVSYLQGRGVDVNHEKALEWFRKAAEAGAASAMANLGHVYEYGKGVPKDPEQAMAWTRKAADAGLEEAKQLVRSWSRSSAGGTYSGGYSGLGGYPAGAGYGGQESMAMYRARKNTERFQQKISRENPGFYFGPKPPGML
jgi:TPR repeat protein